MIFVKSFEWYEPAVGDNSEYTRRASGAYIFRPNGTKTILVGDPTSATLLKGIYSVLTVPKPFLSEIQPKQLYVKVYIPS